MEFTAQGVLHPGHQVRLVGQVGDDRGDMVQGSRPRNVAPPLKSISTRLSSSGGWRAAIPSTTVRNSSDLPERRQRHRRVESGSDPRCHVSRRQGSLGFRVPGADERSKAQHRGASAASRVGLRRAPRSHYSDAVAVGYGWLGQTPALKRRAHVEVVRSASGHRVGQLPGIRGQTSRPRW